MNEPTTPRLRWNQYSLRSLLIFICILCVPLAWVANQREQSRHEADVAKKIEEIGGRVQLGGAYDYPVPLVMESDAGSYGDIKVDSNETWGNWFARHVFGPKILIIECNSPGFRETSLLKGLGSLQWLDLMGTSVRDLAPLAGLQRLRSVFLNHTQVGDLTPLVRVPHLSFVGAVRTKVTKEQVEALEKALPRCKVEYEPFP